MIKYKLSAIAIVLLSAACSRPSKSRTAPVPVGPAPTPVAVQQATPAASAPVSAPAPAAAAQPVSVDTASVTTTDVARRVAEVFGDSALTDSSTVAEAASEGPSWDIDVRSYEATKRVEHYVRVFSGRAKEYIETRLQRGTRYESMIRAKMRDGGIPEDMYYLALVESGFDPNAYSRAAAVGMWQFMSSTGRDMGLRVDWWIDERRDPIKSTTAAVRFLKGLREQFGSLYLAAAAYNGGPGRVARGLSRYADDLEGTTGDDLFFALADKDYLRNETREYVPQLIAVALIAKEPDRYGMKFTALPAFAYDSVRVGPKLPLAAIARAANANVSRIQELNPQILRGMTPPRDSVFVRLPTGAADSFHVLLAELPASERTALTTVVTKKGESSESIARRHGIAARQIAAYNPKLKRFKSGNLAPGQTILVPSVAVVLAATAAPDPSIERYSRSRLTTTYVVKSGETLSGIAKRHHTTTAALMRANGLRRALIFPGQSLVVRGSSKRSTGRSVATKATTSSKSTTAMAKPTASAKRTTTEPAKKTGSKSTSKASTSTTGKKKVGAAKRSAH